MKGWGKKDSLHCLRSVVVIVLAFAGVYLFGRLFFGMADWPWYLWWIPGIFAYLFGSASGGLTGIVLVCSSEDLFGESYRY